MRFYDKAILQYPKTVLLLLTLWIGFSGYFTKDFELDASAESLVLENDKDLKYFRTISERYATSPFFVVTYQPQDPIFSKTSLQHLKALRDELRTVKQITSIQSLLDVPLLKNPPAPVTELVGNIKTLENPKADPQMAMDEISQSPLYKDLLLNLESNITALQLNLPTDAKHRELIRARDVLLEKQEQQGQLSIEDLDVLEQYQEQIHQRNSDNAQKLHQTVVEVRSILDKHRNYAELNLGGVPMIADDMTEFVKQDLAVFGVGVFLFLVLTLFAIFRRIRWTLVALSTCTYVAITMTGLMGFFGWKATVISSNFISLLLILTMSLSIHLIVRYREFYVTLPDASQRELIQATIEKMLTPCFYTSLTTLVAFSSLIFSDIRPIINFGWMMSAGILVAFVAVFLLFPALLMIIGKGVEPDTVKEKNRVTSFLAMLTTQHGNKLLVLYSFLAIFTAVGLLKLKVENSFINYFDESTEIYQGMLTIDQKLGGTTPLDVLIDFPIVASSDDDFADDEFSDDDDFGSDEDFEDDFGMESSAADAYWFTRGKVDRIKAAHDYLDNLDATGKVLSLITMVDLAEDLSQKPLGTLELQVLYQAIPNQFKNLVINPYVSVEHSQARINMRIIDSDPTLERDVLLKKIKHDLVNKLGFDEEDVHISGMMVLYNNMLQSLFTSQIMTLGVVFLGIMLMLIVLFQNWQLAALGIVPNLLASLFVLGIMGWAGLPLDMMTITIAAIAIGIAVDNTIHYVHRFKQEFPKDRNYKEAVRRCHASIGKAVFYTSTIIIIGFSILAASNFKPTMYFGLLTGLAMLTALMGVLTLLPRLIIVFKPLGHEPDSVGKNLHAETNL